MKYLICLFQKHINTLIFNKHRTLQIFFTLRWFVTHEFLKKLKQEGTSKLYEVNAANKKHQIWQRDSLSVEIGNIDFAKQKIEYIHFNPVSGKGDLAKNYLEYYYSSARFYETGVNDFGFLNNIFHE